MPVWAFSIILIVLLALILAWGLSGVPYVDYPGQDDNDGD